MPPCVVHVLSSSCALDHHLPIMQLFHFFLDRFHAVSPKGKQTCFQGHLWCFKDLTCPFHCHFHHQQRSHSLRSDDCSSDFDRCAGCIFLLCRCPLQVVLAAPGP